MKSMLLRFTLFFLYSVQMSGQNYSHEKLDSLNQHISEVILSQEAISRVELDHAIHLSTKAQYSEGIALGYKNIGNFYYFQSKHDSAILFLEKGIRSLKEPYSPVRSRLLMNLGVNNEKLYRFEEAISYYLKALRVSKYNADSASVAITYQNLAQVKSRVQDYSEAKLALDSCLEWAPSLGFNKAAVYSSLGSILNSLGDTSSSINSYQKALKTWPVNKNLREKALLLNNYSNLLVEKKKFNQARENYSAARIVFEQLNDHEGLASNIIGYANLEYFDSNYSKALTLYQEAYELENIGSQLQISLLTNIELSAFKLGEYEIAHTALAKKFLLVDSIAVFDSRAALDSIQSVYAINDLKEQAKEEELLSEQEKLKLSRAI